MVLMHGVQMMRHGAQMVQERVMIVHWVQMMRNWAQMVQERVMVGMRTGCGMGGSGCGMGLQMVRHRWEDRGCRWGQCRERSVWGKIQMKLRYGGAGCGDPGGTGDGTVSRGRCTGGR